MFSTSWKAVCGVSLIFIMGCVSGWLVASVVHYRQTTLMLQRGPEATTELLERRMTLGLDLDPNQQQQIHADFMENLRQRKLLQKQIQPQIQLLNRATSDQILAILRPDQADRFHQNVAQFRERFGKSVFTATPDNQLQPVAQGATTNATVGATSPAP